MQLSQKIDSLIKSSHRPGAASSDMLSSSDGSDNCFFAADEGWMFVICVWPSVFALAQFAQLSYVAFFITELRTFNYLSVSYVLCK